MDTLLCLHFDKQETKIMIYQSKSLEITAQISKLEKSCYIRFIFIFSYFLA